MKTKKISETKCTCQACGNIWHYGMKEQWKQVGNAFSDFNKSLLCCTGCFPALLIQDKNVVDLDKCPKCGSKAVKKENIVHEIQ